jgi:hypothetical protein
MPTPANNYDVKPDHLVPWPSLSYYLLRSEDGRMVAIDSQSGAARLTSAVELAFRFPTRNDAFKARLEILGEIGGLEIHAVLPGSTGP